jgi:HemY protein|tara:strand:- start:8009 stop:9574 length:1566 start_codon:yes stop_codon:yes gene_type:complete
MLRALYTFAIMAVLAALGVWLADNPGDLVLHWRGYEMRTSFVVGLGMLVVLAGIVLLVWRMASGVVRTPASVSHYLDMRRSRRGFLALSRGMVAVAAGDAADAKRYAGRARKLLDETPLTMLLAAQAAQLEGHEDEARGHFEAMLASPETAFLGLRGLFVQARRAGDREKALDYARRAFRLRPNASWAAQAVFEIEAAQSDWGAALRTLDDSLKAKQVSRNDARRRRTVLLTAQALAEADAAAQLTGEARKSADAHALRQAMQAVALDPYFVPAVALAARLSGATGHVRKGAKLVETAWVEAPHPELADAYMGLVQGESGYDRFKRFQLLSGRNRDHVESRVALARAAIGARDWLAARGALEVFVGEAAVERPTQRVCELMAEIEEGEFGNRGSAREWLARALHAPEDPAWTGEGYRSYTWSPINPVTGEFDALEWRVPGMRLAAPEPSYETEDDVVAVAPAPVPVEELPDERPADRLMRVAAEADEAETIEYPVALPDDPGPDGVDDLDEDGASRGTTKW